VPRFQQGAVSCFGLQDDVFRHRPRTQAAPALRMRRRTEQRHGRLIKGRWSFFGGQQKAKVGWQDWRGKSWCVSRHFNARRAEGTWGRGGRKAPAKVLRWLGIGLDSGFHGMDWIGILDWIQIRGKLIRWFGVSGEGGYCRRGNYELLALVVGCFNMEGLRVGPKRGEFLEILIQQCSAIGFGFDAIEKADLRFYCSLPVMLVVWFLLDPDAVEMGRPRRRGQPPAVFLRHGSARDVVVVSTKKRRPPSHGSWAEPLAKEKKEYAKTNLFGAEERSLP